MCTGAASAGMDAPVRRAARPKRASVWGQRIKGIFRNPESGGSSDRSTALSASLDIAQPPFGMRLATKRKGSASNSATTQTMTVQVSE